MPCRTPHGRQSKSLPHRRWRRRRRLPLQQPAHPRSPLFLWRQVAALPLALLPVAAVPWWAWAAWAAAPVALWWRWPLPRRNARVRLGALAIAVTVAGDGVEGLARYRQYGREVRVVVTDLVMPFMDGLALIHALRQLNPQIKIVAMSGHQSKAGVGHLPPNSVQALLTKPFNAAELLKALQQVLHP